MYELTIYFLNGSKIKEKTSVWNPDIFSKAKENETWIFLDSGNTLVPDNVASVEVKKIK